MLAGHDAVELLEQLLGLGLRLPLDRRRHQRRARLGDGAAAPLERHVADLVALELEPDGELVAAQRVLSLGVRARVVHHAEIARPDLSNFYGKEFKAQGIVVSEPERSKSVQRITIRVFETSKKEIDPFKLLVTVGRYPRYEIGDKILVHGTIEKPENYSEFDYVSYLARQDIFATLFFPQVEKIGKGKGNQLMIYLARLKHSFEKNLEKVIPEPHVAFLKGLTLGERESLPADLVENFNRTGTTHIVALSGYNITMLGRFFVLGLVLFTVPFRVSFWIATAGIMLFVLLTGASPSVVRAGIMGILVLIAQKEGRLYQMTNALVFAGAIMILHNPKILRFDAAFQLSFLATLGLIYLSPRIERMLDGRKKFKTADPAYKEKPFFSWKQTLIETLSAQFMVLPLLIYLFGRVSLISPISNIAVIVAVPYAMALGFVTGGLGFLWHPLAQISGWLTWLILEYQIRVIEFFAQIPAASIAVGKWVAIPLVVFYCYVAFVLSRYIFKSTGVLLWPQES